MSNERGCETKKQSYGKGGLYRVFAGYLKKKGGFFVKTRSILLLVVSVVLLVGSISSAQQVVTFNSYMSDPVPRAAMAELIRMFEAQNPDIRIQASTVAHEDFKDALRIWLSSSAPPEVLTWFAGERMKYFVDQNLIGSFTDTWDAAGFNASIPDAFKSISFVDGEAYFLPHSWYWWGVWYRKSIFDGLNLTEPTTWEEFLHVCEVLKENKITPLTIGTRFRWTAAAWFDYFNLRINGLDFHLGLLNGTERFNDPRMLAVFEPWAYLIEKGYFLENAAAYSWQEAVRFLVRGDAAMYLMGQFILDAVPENIAQDLDFFRFPIFDPQMEIVEETPTDGFMLSKNMSEGALRFIQFLGSDEAQEFMIRETGRIGSSATVSMEIYPPLTKKGIQMIRDSHAVTQFFDRDTIPSVADRGMDAFMEFWAKPQEIVRILNALDADVRRLFEENDGNF